jgi:hypothetical protein
MRFILAILLTLLPSATANAQGLTYKAQVHNAPGWLRSTTYSTYSPGPPTAPFTRVNAGAGWDPVWHQYTSGLPVNNYQLLPTVIPCTTASSGSGPSGTGSDTTDGTCHWKYTSVVDYVSITGWTLDGGNVWASGNVYGLRDTTNTGANSDAYQQVTAGCTSTVQPTGTGGGDIVTGDGCIWQYVGTITYSSRSHPYLHHKWWRDTFQGYVTSATFSAVGSITMGAHSVMTITSVTSGSLTVGAVITGTGIPAGAYIYSQLTSTEAGGALGLRGTYQIAPDYINVSSETITGGAGILTVTTPPATHPIDVTPESLIAHPSMTLPGRSDTSTGTFIVSGTPRTGPFLLNNSQAINGGGPTTPTTLYYGRLGQVDIMANDLYHAQLWNDREYVNGQNGESDPIRIQFHSTSYNDAVDDNPNLGWHAQSPANTYESWGYPGFLEAAPGESFADTLAANPVLALSGYNINYGAGVRGVGHFLLTNDNGLRISRLQITADVNTVSMSDDRSGNGMLYDHNLIHGGTLQASYAHPGALACNAICHYHNNLIITSNVLGVFQDYGGVFYNNTIVCPSGTCWAATGNTWDWVNGNGMLMSGNAVFGFQHFTSANYLWNTYVAGATAPATVQGTNNVTDTDSTDAADFPSSVYVDYVNLSGGNPVNNYALPFITGSVEPLPSTQPICAYGTVAGSSLNWHAGVCGITRSVSPTAAFISWPGNYRIKPGGPLVGAGASYPSYNICTGNGNIPIHIVPPGGTSTLCDLPFNSSDLFGSARPQGTRYDTGAVEWLGGATLGGRRLLR